MSQASMTFDIWRYVLPFFHDIRSAEALISVKEMEQERIARENEEKEKAERMKKIKDQFVDPNTQWEKDKSDIQKMAEKAKEAQVVEADNSPAPGGNGAGAGDKTQTTEVVSY
jgi:mannan polymerase II complex ANP1 subunit